jgi:hypothetical protein
MTVVALPVANLASCNGNHGRFAPLGAITLLNFTDEISGRPFNNYLLAFFFVCFRQRVTCGIDRRLRVIPCGGDIGQCTRGPFFSEARGRKAECSGSKRYSTTARSAWGP